MKRNQKILTLMSAALLSLSGCQDSSIGESVSVSTSGSSSEQIVVTDYSNPVWEPVLADPSVIRGDDGMFYAFGTQDNSQWGDFFGVRYIPILQSPDLVNWTYAGQVFRAIDTPTWGTMGAGLWAPDVVKIGTKYVLYYSLSVWGDPNPGIGVASADAPLGPWTDHGKLFDSNSIGVGNSIDPTVYIDEDSGRVYMAWGSFIGIYGVELTEDGLALKDGANAINTKVLLAGIDTGRWNIGNHEAPFIRKIGNYYYMFLSAGTCCDGHSSSYRVVVGRSTSVFGNYTDAEGINLAGLHNRGTLVVGGNDRFVGVGHNSIIQDDAGDYWIVYHGFDKTKTAYYGTTNRRSLLIDKLLWTENGWPYVANYGGSQTSPIPYIER